MEGNEKNNIKYQIKKKKFLMDGAFGTYYDQLYDAKELPEIANVKYPERVLRIHREYIESGAQIIRTNTFASNTYTLEISSNELKEHISKGYALAKKAAEKNNVYVAADIGQIMCQRHIERAEISEEYVNICRTFLEEGAKIFVFETFSDIEEIRDAIEFIGDKAFIIVQFSVNQFGYSQLGLSARKLIQKAEMIDAIDAVGLNCGVGPGHMQKILRNICFSGDKLRTALPNAGYPQMLNNRMSFDNSNVDYFANKMKEIAEDGADIIGGCCGTTPEYIRKMKCICDSVYREKALGVQKKAIAVPMQEDRAFYAKKDGKKLIAVELAPPLGSNDEKLMDAAHLMKKSGIDVITFPDSPSGRTRADSILMAEKVARETGICVMPHICCRDKNDIAIRSQLLGAYINNINNFLIVTGDPIPSIARSSIKGVFNFDSVGLMQIINDMNEEHFLKSPVCYGGAINQGRKNIEIEIGRVKKKMEAGATFFLSQPAMSISSVERLKRIKTETGARILCGIMPFVSLKNALFMKNEMSGIEVTEEVLSRYSADMTREEGEREGILLAKEIMQLTDDFADGYYFSFPFNRVGMLEKILR